MKLLVLSLAKELTTEDIAFLAAFFGMVMIFVLLAVWQLRQKGG